MCAFGCETQEADKFKAAMADAEFQAMLKDYMKEMQDPAHRAVRWQALKQAANEKKLMETKDA